MERGPFAELTRKIIGGAIAVHQELGPGLLESAYERCLALELEARGLSVKRQVELDLHYRGHVIERAYRLDLLVEDRVVVEVKTVDAFAGIHEAQLLTYLRLSHRPVGLLLDFKTQRLVDGIMRRLRPPA